MHGRCWDKCKTSIKTNVYVVFEDVLNKPPTNYYFRVNYIFGQICTLFILLLLLLSSSSSFSFFLLLLSLLIITIIIKTPIKNLKSRMQNTILEEVFCYQNQHPIFSISYICCIAPIHDLVYALAHFLSHELCQ